ncbi:MAG: hypothetical protein GWN62_09695, partial [Aliifodinibius sp.]|nr:hypothetical protein [Fodinibius sp.]
MKFLWLIIALIIPFLSHGQMLFSGEIARNTHWSGNILLEGDVIVKKGVTLTIAPGSRIRISANRDKTNSGKDPERIEIIVIGNLFANGKSNDGQITFTSSAEAPKIKDWYGIVFKNRVESSMLNNCIIEYGYKGITCYGSSPELVNCEIRFNFYGGISAEVRSHPLIKSCILRGNEFAGLICELASNPIVEKTLITQNEYGVLIFDRSQPQLGSVNKKKPGSAGANRIFNNFNLNIYNRSSEQIFAQNNIWNVDNNGEIVNKILDKTDEPAYGEVVF